MSRAGNWSEVSSSLCPDPLWDPSVSWDTARPRLSECLRFTVLAAVPPAVLLLHAPAYVADSRRRWHQRSLFADARAGGGAAHWARVLLALVVAVGAAAKMLADTDFGVDVFFSDLFLAACVGLTSCATTLPTTLDRHLLRHTSPMLFNYWLALLVTSAPTIMVDVDSLSEQGGFQFILRLFSVISFGPAVLAQDSLPRNPSSVHCDLNVRNFLNVWEDEQARVGATSSVSLWRVLFKVHKWQVLWASALYLVHTLLAFVSPQILRLIILHVQSPHEETWKGILYAIVLLVSSLVYSWTFQHALYLLTISSVQVYNSLVAAVYRKSLRLSPDARREHSSGEITNFVTIDCRQIMDSIGYISHLWSDPLTVILVMGFLYMELGIAALAGIGFLLLLVPINIASGKKIETIQDLILSTKDDRMKLTNETLLGMLVIKLSAWEPFFAVRVRAMRDGEVRLLGKLAKLFAVSSCTFSCAPVFVSLVVFAVYVAVDPARHVLTPEKVFVSVSLFSLLRLPLELFPICVFDWIRSAISVQRIGTFLNSQDQQRVVSGNVNDQANVVELENASFAWSDEADVNAVLRDINLRIRRGSLVAVVGKVGSGKTSLLSALLGDCVKRTGRVSLDGEVAYVPQQAWILNATVRDNILFGRDEEADWYGRVLTACALREDLNLLPAGDQTEVGEEGVTLSGGQKQRVALARAAFSDRDVYLFDDPLSAVDARVGKHIFERLLSNDRGLLRSKTRILVTHAVNYLEFVDDVIVLQDGKIVEQGTFDFLMSRSEGILADLVNEFRKYQQADDKILLEDKNIESTLKRRKHLLSQTSRTSSISHEANDDPNEVLIVPENEDETSSPISLMQDEQVLDGKVRWSVYLDYMKVIGSRYSSLILLLFVIGQFFHVASMLWMSAWSDLNGARGRNVKPGFHLGVFGAIGISETTIAFSRQVLLYLGCARASGILHHRLLHHVLRSPMSFFDTTPAGRVANRLSSDLDTADESLPREITDFVWCAVELVSTMLIISYVTPPFLGVVVALCALFCLIVYYYIGSSRQLRRLESACRSPILSHFQQSLAGVASIRAYGQPDRFVQNLERKLDANVKCKYLGEMIKLWLGIRMEGLASLLVFFTALLSTLASRGSVSGGLAGLAVTYATEVMEALTWMTLMACSLETNSVSLERIMEYWALPKEAAWKNGDGNAEEGEVGAGGDTPPNSFNVQRGEVEFDRFSVRYREDLDLSLKEVTFKVSAGSKLGICGWTGAGKTSIVKSLFRVMEAASGCIRIDGTDIASLGLHDLRSALAVIPQDPTLFSGSLRFNLDPTTEFTDAEIWDALAKVNMRAEVEALPFGLDHAVQERGSNFSAGQRQLLCLVRALLRRSKIVVLDEATASVDLETDALMQQTVRREFADSTVIIVAHRLETILDCDEVAVMSDGRLLEKGTPDELLGDGASAFRAMASEAGLPLPSAERRKQRQKPS